MQVNLQDVTDAIFNLAGALSRADLIKSRQLHQLTQNAFVSIESQTGTCCKILWHFQGQHKQFTILSTNSPRHRSHLPKPPHPLPNIAITPLFLCRPSICVMTKRPSQCCWCRSRKSTLLLSSLQESCSMPHFTQWYCYCYRWVLVANCAEFFFI